METNLRIVYKLPPDQGTGEGYVLVKHRKTFRTEKTPSLEVSKNRLNLGFRNPRVWVPPSTPTAVSGDTETTSCPVMILFNYM